MKTKFDQNTFTTSDTTEAMGMWLAKDIIKSWKEDTIDSETGEVITFDRYQLLMGRGAEINPNNAMSINFWLQAGEITEFEVTDQCRPGLYIAGYHIEPYVVTANVKDKNRKFILYARGIEEAIEIAKDFIELNIPGGFALVSVKAWKDCIALSDNFKRSGIEVDQTIPTDDAHDQDEAITGKFYFLELDVNGKDLQYEQAFLVFTTDAEQAKILAEDWINNSRNETVKNGHCTPECAAVTTTIKTASIVNCYGVVPPAFSKVYFDKDKELAEAKKEFAEAEED